MFPVSPAPLRPVLVTSEIPIPKAQLELTRECDKLEALRVSEISLRANLVLALRLLAYFAEQAKFHFENNDSKDGSAHLDGHIATVKVAERRLVDCIAEVKTQERLVAKLRLDLAVSMTGVRA